MSTPHSGVPVCVLGLGLIGGSILRALGRTGRPAYGWNRSAAAVDDAGAAGFDASSDLAATLRRAEEGGHVVVVAVPVPALDGVLAAVAVAQPAIDLGTGATSAWPSTSASASALTPSAASCRHSASRRIL